MSFDGSSDSEWKETKMKTDKIIKQDHSSSNKPKYSQKFLEKWLKIFDPWLARDEEDSNKPFCRACQCRLDCNRCHLQRHELTSKHARNLDILINKGEGAARQNLSIRQERGKYYQKRKMNSSVASSHDISDLGMDTAEDFIEEYVQDSVPAGKTDPDAETNFHFVQTEAPGDHYTEETIMKQEIVSADMNGDPIPSRLKSKGNHGFPIGKAKKLGVKKERVKLLMQIQKDKNDLLESFKELMSGSFGPKSKDRNHVDLFFDSVSTSVKALSPKLIAETKMRVSQLICELELRALTEEEAGNGGATSATVVVAQDGVPMGGQYIINHPVATVVHHSGNAQHHEAAEQHYGSHS